MILPGYPIPLPFSGEMLRFQSKPLYLAVSMYYHGTERLGRGVGRRLIQRMDG